MRCKERNRITLRENRSCVSGEGGKPTGSAIGAAEDLQPQPRPDRNPPKKITLLKEPRRSYFRTRLGIEFPLTTDN